MLMASYPVRPLMVAARFLATRRLLRYAVALLFVAWCPVGMGAIHDDTLAAAVPSSAGFYVELDRLGDERAGDRAISADRLYQLLVGPEDARRGLSVDWRRTIRGLGFKPGEAAEGLLTRRVAIAAPSWKRLAEGILLVRLAPADNFIQKEIFPPDSIDTIDGKGDVTVYRSRHVLSVAVKRRTLIVSQRRTSESLYQQAVDLMLDPTRPSLADEAGFSEALESLTPGMDGFAYIDGSSVSPFPWKQAAAGMYLRDFGAEFAFRATPQVPGTDLARRPVPLERIGLLPRTTLGVWSTELDVRSAFQGVIKRGVDENTPAFAKLLLRAFDVEAVVERCFGKVGPRAIVTWDQQLGPGPDIPQVAVQLEAEDAIASARACAEAVQVVVDWLDLQRRSSPQPHVRFSQSAYLGVTIYEVAMPWTSGSSGESEWVFVPAFAAVDDWLVVAAGADQIRNMIDARWGLTPRVSDAMDIAALDSQLVSLAVAQPALAAQVVDAWLNDTDGFAGRWLGSWMGDTDGDTRRRPARPKLGIGMKPGDTPGTIVVAHVHEIGRAQGRLRPEDRIMGVNGSLLSLTKPTADLRRLVSAPPDGGQWVFRVLRGDEVLDVVVPAGVLRKVSQSATDPAGALRQLQELFELVDFASLGVNRVAPTGTHGRLVLRFTPSEVDSTH